MPTSLKHFFGKDFSLEFSTLMIWLYYISETVRPGFVCKLFLLQKGPSVLTTSLTLSIPFAIHSEKPCDIYLPFMVRGHYRKLVDSQVLKNFGAL